MERFRRSWELFKASWAMIQEDRTLLRYPIVSGIAVIALAILIGGPLSLTGVFNEGDIGPLQIVALFIMYFLVYSAITFCNAAMVSEVMARMDGRQETVSGWGFARENIGPILGYAAIAATVGVVLNLLSRREDLGSQLVGALGGAAWSIATFLVVPVLVVERVSPIDALKRSASLLRRTWGEQLIGNAGIGLFTGLLIVATVVLGAGLVALAATTGVVALVAVAVAIGVLAVAAVIAVSSALDTIYRSAVYRYANGQPIQDYEAADAIPAAFRVKG
jgi:MFS family permease